MQTEATKLLVELKQKKTKKKLTFQQLIVILQQGETTTKQVHKFLVEVHKVDQKPLNWVDLSFYDIELMSQNSKEYILGNREQWKEEQERKKQQQQERVFMEQEKERLKTKMLRNNTTREKMIDMCKDSIKRCQKIMEMGAEDPEEYQMLKSSVKQLRRQLLILEGNFFEELREQGIDPPMDLVEQQDNAELYLIIEEIREKKRRAAHEKVQADQRLKQNQRDSYINKFKKSLKRMRDVYYHYSKCMYNPGTTFEDNRKYLQLIDLKVFIRYLREFQVGSYRDQIPEKTEKFDGNLSKIKTIHIIEVRKNKQALKKASSLFRAITGHGAWMDFSGFVEFHFRFVGSRENLQTVDLKRRIQEEMNSMNIEESLLIDKPGKTQCHGKVGEFSVRGLEKSDVKSVQSQNQGEESRLQEEEQTVAIKIEHLNCINLILSKEKIQKVLRIAPNISSSVESPSKTKGLSRIQAILPKKQYQKEILMTRMAMRLHQQHRQRQILDGKILQARKLIQHKKLRAKFIEPSEGSYRNRQPKLNRINSQHLKPIDSHRFQTSISNHLSSHSSKNLLPAPQSYIRTDRSLTKISSKPISIYDSLKDFQWQNQMSEMENDLFMTSHLLGKSKKSVAGKETPELNNDQDQSYLNEFFNREKGSVKKVKQ